MAIFNSKLLNYQAGYLHFGILEIWAMDVENHYG